MSNVTELPANASRPKRITVHEPNGMPKGADLACTGWIVKASIPAKDSAMYFGPLPTATVAIDWTKQAVGAEPGEEVEVDIFPVMLPKALIEQLMAAQAGVAVFPDDDTEAPPSTDGNELLH